MVQFITLYLFLIYSVDVLKYQTCPCWCYPNINTIVTRYVSHSKYCLYILAKVNCYCFLYDKSLVIWPFSIWMKMSDENTTASGTLKNMYSQYARITVHCTFKILIMHYHCMLWSFWYINNNLVWMQLVGLKISRGFKI